jgi:hypothetical protein
MTWHPTTEAYFLFYTYRIYMYMMYSIFAKSHVAQYTPVSDSAKRADGSHLWLPKCVTTRATQGYQADVDD